MKVGQEHGSTLLALGYNEVRDLLRKGYECYMSLVRYLILCAIAFPALGMNGDSIIGKDNRQEWYEEKQEEIRILAHGTAVFVSRKSGAIESWNSKYRWSKTVKTHAEDDRLCPGERFESQLAPGFCSGFLVAPDLVATANHCLSDGCKSFQVVFDFLHQSVPTAFSSLESDQIYSCKELIASDKEKDWALFRLDRPTQNRPIFSLRKEGKPTLGTPVSMLGYPRGIPLKIANGAQIVENQNASEDSFFEATLDAFGGNSGSAVINEKTLEVEGILTTAFGEFEEDEIHPQTGKPCRRLRHIPLAEATPAWVTRAPAFAKFVP